MTGSRKKVANESGYRYNRINQMAKGGNVMPKALIICAGGMSSSLIAKKTATLLNEQGFAIEMNAVGVPEGGKKIANAEYDLYLISPQTKMHYKQFEEAAKKVNKPIVQIPPQAYIPIPMGIEKMAQLVKDNL